jgi:prepilin-type N-terminal cleavage/methylation domain-containing protein
MKTPAKRRTNGFTLVELLVVIAIIAVLAAAGFAAGNAAIQKAKKVTAQATATAMESAVNDFFTEYGSMPTAQTSDGAPLNTTQGEGIDLLKVLLGMETGTTPMNTRAIKFLSAKEAKGKKGGLQYNTQGSTVTGLYDPWGGPFFVLMDADYDEKVSVPASVLNGGKTLNGRRVAVWSKGADAAPRGEGGKTGDDVTTF